MTRETALSLLLTVLMIGSVFAGAITVTGAGGAGSTAATDGGSSPSTLDVVRNETNSNSNADEAYAIAPTDDGGYILAGKTETTNTIEGSTHDDLYLVKLDSGGNVEWSGTFSQGTATDDRAFDVVQTQDGGFAAVGRTTGGDGATDVYLVKVPNDGSTPEFTATYGGSGRPSVNPTDDATATTARRLIGRRCSTSRDRMVSVPTPCRGTDSSNRASRTAW
jgi:hypothetical protein